MEYCTLPPAGPTPGPSLLELGLQSLAAGTSLEETGKDPCPLSSALLTARPFTWGHKARPMEEEVGTMEPAMHFRRLPGGGRERVLMGLPGVRKQDRQKG